ncbi:MAG: MFS transporter [Candidatus Aenigmarchaeota archaeon]|nr:MFS transporter [Candidatus Aenigmarchaeota archaeon]MCX8191086.1 MFS transporter [Candidatus Aenigmarchaeota archaeon]MDW8160200.1 MFS transporter [Candidatus Aenigmarchaeota archaeon]
MRRREMLALALAQSLIALSTGFIGPIYAIYFEKVIGSASLVALIIGLYWIIVGLLEVPSGYLSDRIGKGKTFLIGGILSSISIILYTFVDSLTMLVLVEILNAIGYSLQVPSFFSLLAEITSKKNRGREMGLIDSFWSLTYGISAIISGIVIGVFGFSAIFLAAGIFNGISSILIGRKFNI